MEHFELVEKLQAKAQISFEEAKQTLENNNWDILEAIVQLEREGRLNKKSAESETPVAQNFYREVREEVVEEGESIVDEAVNETVKEAANEPIKEPIKEEPRQEFYRKSATQEEEPVKTKFTRTGEKISSWAESGNRNFLQISRHGQEKLRVPLTVVVLALIVFVILFPTIPFLIFCFIVGLLVGYRYHVIGPDNHRKANDVMNKVGATADQVTKAVKDEWDKISK